MNLNTGFYSLSSFICYDELFEYVEKFFSLKRSENFLKRVCSKKNIPLGEIRQIKMERYAGRQAKKQFEGRT